jgi:hypothetical protein
MSKEPNKDKPLGKNERVKLDMSFDNALRMAAKKQPTIMKQTLHLNVKTKIDGSLDSIIELNLVNLNRADADAGNFVVRFFINEIHEPFPPIILTPNQHFNLSTGFFSINPNQPRKVLTQKTEELYLMLTTIDGFITDVTHGVVEYIQYPSGLL